MSWAVVMLLAIGAGALAVRWFVNANPASLARRIRGGAVWLIILSLVVLAVVGRLPWLLGLLVPLAPLAIQILMRQGRRPADGWESSAGRQSTVTTDYLDMTFDHDSGQLDGRVIAGNFAGKMLSELSMTEVRTLLDEVTRAQDKESSSVLISYLDRTFGNAWRAGSANSGEGDHAADMRNETMTREEAWRVLGLAPGSSEEDIRSAHRRLMMQLHPDHGGSDYLASKINEAKDLLLHR
jgi:hypothetical protein